MELGLGKKTAAVAIAAATVLGAGGIAAWAESSSAASPAATVTAASGTTTAPSATPAKGGRRARIAAILRRVDHASLEVKTKTGWITVDYDRGKLTGVNGNTLTIARPDGQSVSLTVTPTTKFGGSATSLAELKTGAPTLVVSNTDGTARNVLQPKARAAAAATPTTTAG